MSELPEGVAPAEPPAPRPSAAGVVLRRGARGWEVLLGTRSRRSRFMPGHLAFPGGALDPVDGDVDGDAAYRRAVARELEEEAGFRLAPGSWIPAGERTTPPMFPVRFRTLFFVADAGDWEPPARPPSPDELDALAFHDPQAALAEWERGGPPLPPPAAPLLRALAGVPASAAPDDVAARLAAANAEEDRTPRIEFVPGLWMTPVRTATLPPATHTNVWMPGRSRFAVVDPGCREPAERERLLRTVERRRAAGGAPAAVLLTHEHGDHAGGAWWAARALDVPLHGSAEALAAAERAARAADGSGAAAPRAVEVADGDVLDLDGMRLEALATPGHAPGHVAWWNAEERWLIAGDLLSGMSTILVLPGGGDMDAYLASLERVRALEPARLLPAHGPPLPGKALDKLIAHRLERERKIVEALPAAGDAEASLAAIARAAYPELPDAPAFLVESQTRAHLVRLERLGRARRASGGGWLRASVAAELERRLRDAFAPEELSLRDDSARHAGHPGATSGGGHFVVRIVSARFEGLSLLERHRRVNEAVADLYGARIHALKLETRAPSELG